MNKYDPNVHHRRSIRLKEYDYSEAGAYFVTICTHNREYIFGDIMDCEMKLNEFGQIIMDCWNNLPNHYQHLILDISIIMPNHFHGIIIITNVNNVGAGLKPAPTIKKRHGLSEIVRAFKTFSSRRINQIRNTHGVPVWQRNYYEHIIRNENELNKIR
jgi:putative transposase